MIELLSGSQSLVPYSLEVEKPRAGIELLFKGAEIILFSRHYANSQGYNCAASFLRNVRRDLAVPLLFCAWGADGAYVVDSVGNILYCTEFPPAQLQDTLGAGDVFNAAVIHGLLSKSSLVQTLGFACRLAGHKCGRIGLYDLGEAASGISITDEENGRLVRHMGTSSDYGSR